VTAESSLVNTDDQTISQTLNSRDVIDLPRDSRDVYDFLYLNPNITQSGEPGDFKFVGAQSYGASFSLDGQRSNGGIFGTATASQPSLEGVQEINVMSTDFSAEYAGIANIRVTTKRGTAHYHGSLFYENENSALSAWTVQDKVNAYNFAPTAFQSQYTKPFFNINDLGASFGGPIPKLKNTWFFTSYERDYNDAPVAIGPTSNLANPQLWTGNFSNVLDADKPLVPASVTLTPQETAQDTVGGLGQQFIQIPQRLLNPYVQKLITTYFPQVGTSAPINPVNGTIPDYETNLPGLGVQDLGTIRVDHDFSPNDHIFTSLNIGNFSGNNGAPVASPDTGLGLLQRSRRNYTLANSYTKVIRPNLINEVRGGYNWQDLLSHSNTSLQSFLSSIGFSQQQIAAYGSVVGQSELPTYGEMAVRINGYTGVGNGGRSVYRPQDQHLLTFGDTVTWVVGRHNIRTGGDTIRNQADDGYPANRGNPRGLLTYTGQGTDSFADFLLGLPPNSVSYVASPRPPMNVHNWENGYFIQDDFKVTPNLTLNLGFRYELTTPFIDANSLMVNFDPNFTDPTTGQVGRFIVPSTSAEQYLTPAIINYGVVTAAQSGLGIGPGLVHTDKSNWAPRVGFAWRLGSKNVLRGGWGIYYNTSAAQGIRDALESAGFNQGATARSKPTSPLTGWPSSSSDAFSPISGGAVSGFGNTPSVNIIDFNLRNPRIQQYNVTFERDLGWQTALRVSYLGSWMNGLIEGRDLNEIPPNNIPFGTTQGDGVTICDPYAGDCAYSPQDMARMRFPALGDFVMDYSNIGHGYSNAFQLQVEHRFSSGLQFLANYTYLNQIVTTPDTDNSSLGGELYDPFSASVESGQDAFVSHHRFIAYGVYNLPVGRDRKFGAHMSNWLDAAIGGWQTTFNMFIKSGDFFTPYWVCNDCDPVIPGNIISGAIDAVEDFGSPPSFRPTVLSNNYNQTSGDQIWNPAAFGPPSIGADLFSNPAAAPRNLLEGPGAWGLNLGVHKSFRFGEHVTAMLGADADNLLNHPIFMPDQNYAGGGSPFAMLGTFNVAVDQNTGQLLPITDITPNPLFGVKMQTFMQEAVAGARQFRLRLRITF
ncbi:MAG: TonB-dependent receptor, partial [Acidobacteriaceae bacterium]|nr:TonB-dependent receptor [Acidobacteriaceae bacterium]